jgi:pimeloyl-ACP methyl ester carboxylesterase
MARKRSIPDEHPAFSALPVRHVHIANGLRMAVHVAGTLSSGRIPVVCLPGYQRNMSDFTEFVAGFQQAAGSDWPVVLLDLPGRGRSDDRAKGDDYNSLTDSRDVANAITALGIDRAVVVGQGHGGQVAMGLAMQHPLLLVGTVLLDSGPVSDPRGIVRLRGNLAYIESLKGANLLRIGFHRMLGGGYPDQAEERLDALVSRTHWINRRGRAQPLYDPRLIDALKTIEIDDVLVAQWPLYDALCCAPLLLLRTQLTDQIRRETFEEMQRRRPEATALVIAGQGSPALFDQRAEIEAVAAFVTGISAARLRRVA